MKGWPQGWFVAICAFAALAPLRASAQGSAGAAAPVTNPAPFRGETTQSLNARLAELAKEGDTPTAPAGAHDYIIGAEDLLSISVFEAPELAREVRVSSEGLVSLPLMGEVHAGGRTARQLEAVIEELLRRSYMKDPHVTVFIKEMQSHPVSVFGAVKKPGVFQIRTGRSLIEVLSLAEGLAEDAGDTVIVMRHTDASGPSAEAERAPAASDGKAEPRKATATGGVAQEIDLRDLLGSGDSRLNITIYPGDVVKVTRAGIVYVIGEVGKPGGYLLKTNENISILQAIALAGGLTHTSAAGRARIIRTDPATGARLQLPLDINRILHGKASDELLQAKDIVFVPNSAGKAVLYRSTEGIASVVGGALIYRY
jgi:polysaccharide biosynthesis/export protein